MNPVRETFAKTDAQARYRLRHKAYAQSTPPYGHAYYGRGYVQLTWKKNYQKQEDKLRVPLVQFPDLALETENAVRILVDGMLAGDFNASGRGLEYYVNSENIDFVNARHTVNVLDRAQEIAGYAWKFLDAIEYASSLKPVTGTLRAFEENLIGEALIQPSYEHMAIQRALISEEVEVISNEIDFTDLDSDED